MCHTSPVEFNQSDDNFKTPEVFPILCALYIRHSANSVGVTSEADTTHYVSVIRHIL